MSRKQYVIQQGLRPIATYSGAALVAQPLDDTTYPVSSNGQMGLVASLFVGKCSVAGTTEILVQDSLGYGVWSTAKTEKAAITSSTEKTATFTADTSDITITAHGYATGSFVVFSGTALPAGIDAGKAYRVENVSANVIRVSDRASSAVVVPTSTGTSVSATAVREFRITLNSNNSTLSSQMPLAAIIRPVLTKANNDSVQVVDFLISG